MIYYRYDHMKRNDLLRIPKDRLDRTQQVHVGGVKMLTDGSVSGQTAWVHEPFEGTSDQYGIPTTTKEEMIAAAEAAKSNKIQLIVHAMGERAIDFVVDEFYEVDRWLEDGPSVRVEHATIPTEQAIERAAKGKIGFVPQTVFLFAEIESYLKNFGEERTKRSYPIKTFLENDILTALSSDAPATAWADSVNPFIGIQSAVTRIAYQGTDYGQDERIDVETAIKLYTKAAQEMTRIPNVG